MLVPVRHFFAFSPISTSRRMASERVAEFSSAHFSMRPMRSSDMRTPYNGSVPVAGLPTFLRLTDIGFAIIAYNVNLGRVEGGFRRLRRYY
jgi:hypothetical protein